jgi:hypothetical protein
VCLRCAHGAACEALTARRCMIPGRTRRGGLAGRSEACCDTGGRCHRPAFRSIGLISFAAHPSLRRRRHSGTRGLRKGEGGGAKKNPGAEAPGQNSGRVLYQSA